VKNLCVKKKHVKKQKEKKLLYKNKTKNEKKCKKKNEKKLKKKRKKLSQKKNFSYSEFPTYLIYIYSTGPLSQIGAKLCFFIFLVSGSFIIVAQECI
jgi:hypothetical protein